MYIIQACALADFDVETQTCMAPQWIAQPGLLPPLSVAQGSAISTAMISVIAIAWGLKALRRFIWPRA